MKRVLIVGSDFAPSSHPPALRVRFLARHLPEFGWEPIILTTQPEYYETAWDPEMNCLVPEWLQVIRTPALSSHFTRMFGVGDLGIRTILHHWKVLNRLCRQRKVDLVFIPVPPYMPMVLGRMVHDKFGIPYVIDYMDPWRTEYYWKVPKARRPPKWVMAYAVARLVEPFAVRRAAHIVGVSKGTTDGVLAHYPWLQESDASEIPFGGESDDWEYIRKHPRRNEVFDRNDGFLHVCSVGAYTEAMRPVLQTLFAATRLGRARAPELFRQLRLHFVGTNYTSGRSTGRVLSIAQEAGVAELVDEEPNRLPYLSALQVLSDATGLLVVGSEEPHYTASKIFPYILAHKPLLTIFHRDSSVAKIVEATRSGKLVTFSTQEPLVDKVDHISRCLEELLMLPPNYRPPTEWEAFEEYTTRSITLRLAEVFDKVIAKRWASEILQEKRTLSVKL